MNKKYEEIKKIVKNKIELKQNDLSYEDIGSILFVGEKEHCKKEIVRRLATLNWFINEIEKADEDEKTRILSLSDFHIPFELPISTFEGYKNKVDILQLNGDLVDMQAISKFGKTFRVPIMEEIIKAREYFIELIRMIKPKKVSINYGNHEVRFENYLAKALENDMVEFMPKTPLEMIFIDGFSRYDKRENTKVFYEPLNKIFSNTEIEYTGNWWSKIGQTIFCHPLAYKGTPMATSEKARQWFKSEGYNFDCLVMAHTHRIGSYKVGNTMLYEEGSCCDTKKCMYANGRLVNSQKEGFLYLIQDKDGKLVAEQSKLIYLN